MSHSVKKLGLMLFTITLIVAGWVAGAGAQEESASAAVIHSGNTYIRFEKAGERRPLRDQRSR